MFACGDTCVYKANDNRFGFDHIEAIICLEKNFNII